MKKKVLFVLALLVAAGAVFAQAPTLDKLTISSTSIVSAANKQISGEVVIPATNPANGRSVPYIETDGFRDCTRITSVIFLTPTSPHSMVIRSGSFLGCTNLTSVTIPERVNFQVPNPSFDGDLYVKFRAGGAGTYTRQPGGTVWTKVGGTVTCPTCGGTGVIHQ